MNVSLDRRLRLSAPPQAARIDEAVVVAMGEGLSAIFFDRPAGGRARMQARQDGEPIQRPFFMAELALRSGGARHVLFVPQGVEEVLSRPLTLLLDGIPAAEIDPGWLQLPQEELDALVAQVSVCGLRRLLRMMLTTGASLFPAEAQAALAEAALRLMDLCDIGAVPPTARSQIAGRMLVSYGAVELPDPKPMTAVAVVEGRLIPLKQFDHLAEGGSLHLLLPPGLVAAQVVILAEVPLRLAAVEAALPLLPIAGWLQGRGKACGEWLSTCAGGTGLALARPVASGAEKVRIECRHISSVATGLLFALSLQDPARALGKLVLGRQGGSVEILPTHAADGSILLTGFADLPGPAQGGDHCEIHGVLTSGHRRLLATVPIAAFDGNIPAAFPDTWALGQDAIRPLAQARRSFRRAQPPSTSHHFGPARQCALRIVTAIGNSADLIRARAAMILAEDARAPVEVICTMSEGPLALAARQLLADTAAIYDLPHRLVLLPEFANAAERMRAALAEAPDLPVLLLGADVLPEAPGWLGFWRRRLRRQEALAAALLAADGAIAALQAGADPCQGLHAEHLPASGRPAPRPLPDCLALTPAGIARLLATAPHPDPAVWIASALGGSARSETRFPFRRFAPAKAVEKFAAALAEHEFSLIEERFE